MVLALLSFSSILKFRKNNKDFSNNVELEIRYAIQTKASKCRNPVSSFHNTKYRVLCKQCLLMARLKSSHPKQTSKHLTITIT